jgi:aminoglycoside 3-N-acetyltransferase
MNITTEGDFRAHVAELGLCRGASIVVHSRLISFGRFPNANALIYRILREAVGPEGTIAVPTYTFNASSESPYNPAETHSINVGVFSEYVRTLPGAIRSLSPIHNHAAIGPKALLMRKSLPTGSLGVGTDFQVMHDEGFDLILLGCKFNQGCTYLHHMEALVNVPYRKWINVDRILIDPETKELRNLKVRYFARDDMDWKSNFDVVESRLEKNGFLKRAKAPLGNSFFVSLPNLHNCVYDMLSADPYSLVERKK